MSVSHYEPNNGKKKLEMEAQGRKNNNNLEVGKNKDRKISGLVCGKIEENKRKSWKNFSEKLDEIVSFLKS